MTEQTALKENEKITAEKTGSSASEVNQPLKKTRAQFDKRERLHSDVELTLHVKAVRLLCLGYTDADKIGLLRFAQLTQVLWTAARHDDPYAEWRLMELYENISRVQEELKKMEERCNQRLSQLRGLRINLYSNPDPFRLELRFASPFSFMAACLIADLDYVERQFFTLNRLGLVLEGQATISGYVSKVQEILRKPLQSPDTGITRRDIRELNDRARKIIAEHGEVPEPIFNKTLKFAFLPK